MCCRTANFNELEYLASIPRTTTYKCVEFEVNFVNAKITKGINTVVDGRVHFRQTIEYGAGLFLCWYNLIMTVMFA